MPDRLEKVLGGWRKKTLMVSIMVHILKTTRMVWVLVCIGSGACIGLGLYWIVLGSFSWTVLACTEVRIWYVLCI